MYSAINPIVRYAFLVYLGIIIVSIPFMLIYSIWWSVKRIRIWIHQKVAKEQGK